MTSDIYHLPLNVYVIVLGIGLFVFMLSLIFCCYLFRSVERAVEGLVGLVGWSCWVGWVVWGEKQTGDMTVTKGQHNYRFISGW